MKTSIRKDHHGWNARSLSFDCEITTMKRYSGRIVSTMHYLDSFKTENGFEMTEYSPFSERNSKLQPLVHSETRATEKTIAECHRQALLHFDHIYSNILTK